MTRSLLAGLAAVALLCAGSARAAAFDEPGTSRAEEEPGLWRIDWLRSVAGPPEKAPAFRFELAYGWASMVSDKYVGEGMGGGLFLAWGLRHRVGVELSICFAHNPYEDKLSTYGGFMAGNISLGPIFQLTRPGSRFMVTVDLGMGGYIIPLLPPQSTVWTLGISGGTTIGYRLTSWFGFGIKIRYHLFHLAGGDFRDLNAFQPVGVIDRFEIPGYLAFYF